MTNESNEGLTRRGALVAAVAGAATLAAAGSIAASSSAVEGDAGAKRDPDEAPGSGRNGASGARMPVAFIPHGGGPWPWVDLGMSKAELDGLSSYLRDVQSLPKTPPKALLVVSAHWEAQVPTVMTASRPTMLYDYHGFPPESYEIQWPAPGDPALAVRVQELLGAAGFQTASDARRGFDHGTFVPLKLTYPDANVPTVQLSLKTGLDPAEHIAMGRALAPLRDQGVFIIGSGMTYHNMRGFRDPGGRPVSEAFDAWLRESATAPTEERDKRLTEWLRAPSARQAHPREEHLLPLMVVAGAAGADRGSVAYNGAVWGIRLSAYHYG